MRRYGKHLSKLIEVAHAGDHQTFLGMEDNLRVINLPSTKLITDDMDRIIGGHMDSHILDGKRILRQGHRCSYAWPSYFLWTQASWWCWIRGLKLLLQVTVTLILGPLESYSGHY